LRLVIFHHKPGLYQQGGILFCAFKLTSHKS
jgi:hypothetical protein